MIKAKRTVVKSLLGKNRNSILREFGDVVAKDSLKARNLIKKLNYKNDPYLLECIAQTYLDESRFHDDGTPREDIEWRKWRMAERYIIKAFTLDADCLMVLSTMGSVRKSSGQNDIAIYCFEKIIKRGVKGAKSTYSNLDRDLARELVNDAKFELYRLHYEDNPRVSKKYLTMYKKGLEKGTRTIYKPLKKFLLE